MKLFLNRAKQEHKTPKEHKTRIKKQKDIYEQYCIKHIKHYQT